MTPGVSCSAEFEEAEQRLQPFLNELQARGLSTELSPVIKSPEEVELGSPLFLDMVDDVRLVFDEQGFFAARLARLKERLVELGSRRVRLGNAWYWELKPDFKPGEVFEL